MGAWKLVPSFPGSSGDAVSRLDRMLGDAGVNAARFEADSGRRAIVAELGSIQKACRQAGLSFLAEGIELDSTATILALSTPLEESSLEELLSILRVEQEPLAGTLSAEGVTAFRFRPVPPSLPPVREKIGEGPDNLRRRAEWFERRSGRR